MKNVLFFLGALLMFSSASFAASFNCKGKGKDKAVSVSILSLAKDGVKEGDVHPVAVRVDEAYKTAKGYESSRALFADVVNGVSEDVQWFLTSKDEKSLSGTVYLDDDNFTLTVNGREITFYCENQ